MGDTIIDLNGLLKFAITQGVTDIHLKPGRPPIFRRAATMDLAVPKGLTVLDRADVEKVVEELLDERHKKVFEERGEVDFSWGIEAIGRLRISLHKTRHGVQAVMRVIPPLIPTIQQLGLPKVVEQITNEKRGLILVTGAAGQGKSTTLASITDHLNKVFSYHIITIEDPIEYLIEDRKSVVTQREVGKDTLSFKAGLRSALRQDPDVIVVGEMRDKETVETALIAAETGHLVISTMHTVDARETVNRVISVFSETEKELGRHMLASVLKAVISQRLIPRADGRGRVPAVEVMIVTPRIKELLLDPKGVDEIPQVIAQGFTQYGMQTFDQSITSLYREGKITYDEAIRQCSNPSDFVLKIKGITSGVESSVAFGLGSDNGEIR